MTGARRRIPSSGLKRKRAPVAALGVQPVFRRRSMYSSDLPSDLHRIGPALEERPHVAEPARVGALHRVDPEVVPAGGVEVDVLVLVGDHAEVELVGLHEVHELHVDPLDGARRRSDR